MLLMVEEGKRGEICHSAEPSAKHIINEEFIKNYDENNDEGYIF